MREYTASHPHSFAAHTPEVRHASCVYLDVCRKQRSAACVKSTPEISPTKRRMRRMKNTGVISTNLTISHGFVAGLELFKKGSNGSSEGLGGASNGMPGCVVPLSFMAGTATACGPEVRVAANGGGRLQAVTDASSCTCNNLLHNYVCLLIYAQRCRFLPSKQFHAVGQTVDHTPKGQ